MFLCKLLTVIISPSCSSSDRQRGRNSTMSLLKCHKNIQRATFGLIWPDFTYFQHPFFHKYRQCACPSGLGTLNVPNYVFDYWYRLTLNETGPSLRSWVHIQVLESEKEWATRHSAAGLTHNEPKAVRLDQCYTAQVNYLSCVCKWIHVKMKIKIK